MSQDPAGFIGRWSRRKSEARQQAETAADPAAGVAQASLADTPFAGAPAVPASAPDAIQSALPRDDAAGPADGPLPDAEPRRD